MGIFSWIVLGLIAGALAFVAAVTVLTGCDERAMAKNDAKREAEHGGRLEIETACEIYTSLRFNEVDPCVAHWLRVIAERR